jgi:protocatechuate 3,4-dioxygenase beta subunit
MLSDDAAHPTRRGLLPLSAAALLLPLAPPRAAEPPDAQPLARASHFPQMATGGTGVTPCGSLAPPAHIASFGRVAPPSKPGQPLEITGTIYQQDRRTPAPDIVLFAYHTDQHGNYNTPNSPFRPRLYGWIRTDAQGRYGFRTIKPAPYPDHSTPAHIHVSLFGKDVPEYWVDDYWFAGDPLITAKERAGLTGRGGGGETLALEPGADGALHGRRDFVLQTVRAAGGCQLLHA